MSTTGSKRGPKGPAQPLSQAEIAKVREVARRDPRDFALFTIGTNTAFRASDILALNIGDVRGKDELRIKERKTGKWRVVPLNGVVKEALKLICSGRRDSEPLFVGHKRGTRLTGCTLARLWRCWCEEAGVGHRGGSHVGRKTWARTNFTRGARIEVISRALNHGTPATTFAYICVTDSELRNLYNEV